MRAEGIRNKRPPDGDVFTHLIRIQEQSGIIPNLIDRGAGVPNNTATGNFHDVETRPSRMGGVLVASRCVGPC